MAYIPKHHSKDSIIWCYLKSFHHISDLPGYSKLQSVGIVPLQHMFMLYPDLHSSYFVFFIIDLVFKWLILSYHHLCVIIIWMHFTLNQEQYKPISTNIIGINNKNTHVFLISIFLYFVNTCVSNQITISFNYQCFLPIAGWCLCCYDSLCSQFVCNILQITW